MLFGFEAEEAFCSLNGQEVSGWTDKASGLTASVYEIPPQGETIPNPVLMPLS